MGLLRSFLRLALIVTALIGVFVLSAGRADSAIGLECPVGGEAVWFSRTCQDAEKQDVGSWSVELDRLSGSKALSAQLGNTYPGYRLQCELHLANTGQMPLTISQISISNPTAQGLALGVTQAAGDAGRVLQPCKKQPAWGTSPGQVAANCQAQLNFSVLVNPTAAQSRSYTFGVQVLLKEAVGGRP